MAHIASFQGADLDQFEISVSTATPIGFFSGKEILRLEIGTEGNEL
jgi:hypothetical protein